jgi:hypothetical protein
VAAVLLLLVKIIKRPLLAVTAAQELHPQLAALRLLMPVAVAVGLIRGKLVDLAGQGVAEREVLEVAAVQQAQQTLAVAAVAAVTQQELAALAALA